MNLKNKTEQIADNLKKRICQCENPDFKYSKSSDYSVHCMKCFKPLTIPELQKLRREREND